VEPVLARPINLLLIEDNPGDVRLAQETLKDYKLQNNLQVIYDGEEALACLRRQGPYAGTALPDMILLDLNLPKVDGLEIMKEMQKDAELRSIPLVILTASHLDEEFLKRYDIPSDCFIMKPLTLERYLEAIKCFPHLGLSIVRVATA
jgi:CheY-like chemotaxis protein